MASSFYLKQGDRLPVISATLTELTGSAVDLTGCTVQIRWKVNDGTAAAVTRSATVTSAATGAVEYAWASGDTDTVGTYDLEWVVTYASGKIRTFPAEDYNTFVISRKIS